MKKVLLVLGSLIALILVAALVLPFVVDFNKFKPQIKTIVGESVNADLEFESARLTILTGLGVRLEGVQIKHTDPDFEGLTLFSVDHVDFRADLMPLLNGRFEGYFSIKGPLINVAQKGQTNNLAALPRPSDAPPAETAPEEEKPMTPEEKAKQEAMIEDLKSRVVVREFAIEDAVFHLLDMNGAKPVDKVTIKDLDIRVQNIGLEQDIVTTISTETAVKDGGIDVSGPIALNLTTQINTNGSAFEKASVQGKVDLDQLAINVQNAFVKGKGVPLNVTFGGVATSSNLDLSQLAVQFHSIKVDGNARINGFDKLDTDLTLAVNAPDLKGLGDVLPQHKDMLIGGSLNLKLVVDGLLSDLNQLTVALDLGTKLTGADLTVDLDVQNAKAPIATVNVRSNELDIDQLIGPFLPKGESAKPAETPVASKPEKEGPPPEDVSLTAEQKELLAPADINLDVSFAKINYDTLDIHQLAVIAHIKDLKAQLTKFGLHIFDGSIVADGAVDLAASPIAFNGHLAMNAIETSKIVELVAPEHKDVLVGKANFDLTVAGQGTTVPTLSKELDGRGTFAFLDGQLNGASVSEEIAQQLNGFIQGSSITGAADGVFQQAEKTLQNPALQKAGVAKKVNLDQYKSKYQGFGKVQVSDKLKSDQSLKDVKGELEIKDGRIHITSVKASDAGAYDLAASVGIDMTLAGGATFVASQGLKNSMTAQSQYASLMFDDQGNFALPISLSGTVTDPGVNIDFSQIKNRFTANARGLVEKEIGAQLGSFKDQLLKGKVDEAKAEIAKKKAEAQKKLDEAKKKKEAEAKAKADAEKKKGQDKAKDALKKKFGI